MKKIWLIFLTLIITSGSLFSQWQVTYGGEGIEYASSIVNTFDGGFAVTGYTSSYGFGGYDISLLKLNSNGNLQWVKTFGGAEDDNAYCVIQSSDSGYVIAGSTLSYGQGYYEDMFVVKLNSAGELIWAKIIGRSGLDIAYTLKQTSDRGFIVVGYTATNSPSHYGFMITKISESGAIQWTKMADSLSNGLLGPSVIQDSDGGYCIAGTIYSPVSSSDICFMKINSTGLLQWSWAISGDNDEQAFSVCHTEDMGYAVAGFSNSFGAGYPDLYIIKFSKDNYEMPQWTRTIGGDNDDYALSIMNSTDGSLVIAGESFSYGAGSMDMYIVKMDLNGRLIWNKTVGGAETDFIRSIAGDNDGGYVAAGRKWNSSTGASDMYIVKTDSVGNTCNTTSPVPYIDSGGTFLRNHVNIYNITPSVLSISPVISGWGSLSYLCFTEVIHNSELIPGSFFLHQNYPNPFNPITNIRFEVQTLSNAKIIIYDLLGREVTTLVNEQLKPGSYQVDWDGSNYASGVYFYSLITDAYIETKRMVLIK